MERTYRRMVLAAAAVTTALCCGCGSGCGSGSGEGRTDASGDEPARAEEKPPPSVADEVSKLIEEARAAAESRDWPRARRAVRDGIALATSGGREHEVDRAALLLALGDVERETGREVEARRSFADAMAIYRVHGDSVGRLRVHLSQARLEERLGDYAAAERQIEEAEALAAKVEDPSLKGDLLIHSGRLASRQVDREKAYEAFLEAVRVFDVAKDQRSRAEAYVLLAFEEDAMGQTGQCRRSLEKALHVFEEIGDREGQVRALHRLATLEEREGNVRRARSQLEKVRDLYAELNRSADATKVDQHINAMPE